MKRILCLALFLVPLVAAGLSRVAVARTEPDPEAEQAAIEAGEGLSSRGRKILFRARSRQDEGDYEEAARIVSAWLDGNPDREHPLLLFNLALSRFALGQDQSAYRDLTRAVALEPRYGRAWLRLGEAAYGLEKYREAGEAFEQAYDLSPDRTPEVLYYAGVGLLQGKEPERALDDLVKLLTEHRAEAPLDWYQALIAAGSEANQPDRVQPFVDQLLQDNPSDARAWELSYRFAAGREDYRSAAVSLTITGYLRSLTRDELVQLGNLYAAVSVPVQAARYYEQALARPSAAGRVETGRAKEFERLASAWLRAHDPARARQVLETALAEKETVGLWSLQGDLEYMDEDYEAALQAFGHACGLDPGFGRGWLMMGTNALELGRDAEARRYLEKALDFPGQATIARGLLRRIGS